MGGDVRLQIQLERTRGETRLGEVAHERGRQRLAITADREAKLERHAQTCGRRQDGTHGPGLGQGLTQIRLEITTYFGFERRLIQGLRHAAILAAHTAARRVALSDEGDPFVASGMAP